MKSPHTHAYLYFLISTLFFLGGCDGIKEPVPPLNTSPDKDLSIYINGLLETARAMPTSALARGRLGMAYDVNGLQDEALLTYQQAAAIDPEDFRWPYFSAHLIIQTGEYDQALKLLQQAISIDNNYSPAWLWRGSWLLKAGLNEDAMVAFEHANNLKPGIEGEFGLAQVLISFGQYSEALEKLDSILETTSHPYIYRTQGEALRALGRTDEARIAMIRGKEAKALDYSDKILGERSIHLRGHSSFQYAQQLSASGHPKQALVILKRLQNHHPEKTCGSNEGVVLSCNLMNSSAIAYDRSGLPSRALEVLHRGIELNEEYIPFHITLGNLYRRQGKLNEAIDYIDRAIELNPARGYTHEQRGRLLFGLSLFKEAQNALMTALELEPQKRTTLFYLGLTAIETNNWDDALGYFKDVTNVEPSFALGYVFVARSLAELGRYEESRKAQSEALQYGADQSELKKITHRRRTLELQSEALQ
ncbi:MAG: hypothetical protein CMP95_05250 [Gammaproteobacteria bacterium]|nr:hypothetical protein [Gammaproteobacteria bacterium]OUV68143.1 MAG: hypothetical protein CBC93_02100 [Gammaproteobacteria bacterium TMED133]